MGLKNIRQIEDTEYTTIANAQADANTIPVDMVSGFRQIFLTPSGKFRVVFLSQPILITKNEATKGWKSVAFFAGMTWRIEP